MSKHEDDQKNKKFVKLVSQVKTLSKIVNELQAEVDDLKSRASNKNHTSTSEEPKVADANGSKLSRFQRLKIFRKDSKTKEGVTAATIDPSKDLHATGERDTRPDKHSRSVSINHQEQATNKSSVGELSFEDKNDRRDRSTQSVSFPKEIEFSCSFETCASKTENNCEDCAKSQKYRVSQSDFDYETMCRGCHKTKKKKINKDNIKSMKLKNGKCAKDCPYLSRDKKDDKKDKKKYKCRQQDSAVGTCCNESKRTNKKTMVNFMKNDKAEARKFITANDNFSFDCKLFKSSPYSNEEECKGPRTTNLQSLDHDDKCFKVKEKYCKRCFKKCKSVNVLKINKAILTHDPPVIVMSSRES